MAHVTQPQDRDPRVRPDELEAEVPRRSRSPLMRNLLAVLVGVTAVLVLLIGQGDQTRVAGVSTTTTSEPPATTTTSTPAPTTTVRASETLRVALPDSDGTLLAAVGLGPVHLVTWSSTDRPSTGSLPMWPGPFASFDPSARYMAFLGPSETADSSLYVGDWREWHPLTVGASSFRWHARDAGRIAWTGPNGLLCSGVVMPQGGFRSLTCLLDVDGSLLGFDEAGFLLASEGEIVRLDADGSEIARVPGGNALIGPDGDVVVVEANSDPGAATSFSVTDPSLQAITKLASATAGSGSVYRSVAVSPNPYPSALAFLLNTEDDEWRIDISTIAGESLASIPLEGRFWDIVWDTTGRYVLTPGQTADGHQVFVYDTFTDVGVYIAYSDRVQEAHLLNMSVCEDAAPLAGRLRSSLPDAADLNRLRMVRSRDARLDGWYFVSTTVETGAPGNRVATWLAPGYDGDAATGIDLVPANELARSLDDAHARLEPADHGFGDWMHLDGARTSQLCVTG